LRDYGVDGQIGLEVTPDAYIANLVEVFRECKRILRDDGTLWVNISDSYASKGVKQTGRNDAGRNNTNGFTGSNGYGDAGGRIAAGNSGNAKPKDLIGIPWMLAFALRADGWYLRQDIIWAKPNPMPESVKDRCTKSHEYIFLLSKSARYYYDNEAIMEIATGYDGRKDTMFKGAVKSYDGVMPGGKPQSFAQNGHERWQYKSGVPVRNKRDVWTVTTKPYKGAHYATYPPDLITPCILAGAPETCCAKCGAPYERVVERETIWRDRPNQYTSYREINGQPDQRKAGSQTKTTGYQPTCTCNAGTSSGIVFDPFVGSGTTVATAIKLGRKGIGIDLNIKYLTENARQRIADAQKQPRLI
jgi:DNA modification methylase